MTTHVFDTAVALQPAGDGLYEGHTHPAWANMVGPFGGITAATLLNAALVHPRRIGEPAALTVNYAGPVADGPFTIEAVPVRTSRSTQHWTLLLRQDGEVATLATALFAVRRDTWGGADLAMPDVPPADTIAPASGPPLQWVHNYDLRFAAGTWVGSGDAFKAALQARGGEPAPPVQENADSLTQVWVRDAAPRPLDVLSLAAMCDVFYPRIYRRRPRVVPAGTVSITSYFHASAADYAAQGTRHVLGCARAGRFAQGFFDQSAEVWSDSGVLLARSHQTVYYKE